MSELSASNPSFDTATPVAISDASTQSKPGYHYSVWDKLMGSFLGYVGRYPGTPEGFWEPVLCKEYAFTFYDHEAALAEIERVNREGEDEDEGLSFALVEA